MDSSLAAGSATDGAPVLLQAQVVEPAGC
jgi:hypothetical protein